MLIYDYSNIENIYVLGGICGDFNYIPSTLNRGYDETKKQVEKYNISSTQNRFKKLKNLYPKGLRKQIN